MYFINFLCPQIKFIYQQLSGLFVNPIYLQQDCYVCSWLTSVVNKLILVRKDMDVNEHERLSNFILGHKLKLMNMRDNPTLHLDTN
jgi:hypothetical protein